MRKQQTKFTKTLSSVLMFTMLLLPVAGYAQATTTQLEEIELKTLLINIATQSKLNLVISDEIKIDHKLYLQPNTSDYTNQQNLTRLNEIINTLNLHSYKTTQALHVIPQRSLKHLPAKNYIDSNTNPTDWVYHTLKVDKNVCVSHIVPMLRTLMPRHGHLAQSSPTNSLVLFDRKANIDKLISIIRDLEKHNGKKKSGCKLS